jgi:small GTP-binding protein
LGDLEDEMSICQVYIEVLLQGRKPTLQYSNAKVVLMGDSGVGKTALFDVIRGEAFTPTSSTHARHVFVLDNETVALNGQGMHNDNKEMLRERREILLWDLAGQPGYRVIHQLHLNEVTVALVVFDARNETDPFAGVRHWERALRQTRNMAEQASLPLKKLLVAARVDRGGIAVSKERINEFMRELSFDDYIETSAKDGFHIAELHEMIKGAIQWDALPRVTSNELFETIKEFLLQKKLTGEVLTHIPDLYSSLINAYKIGPNSPELRAQFERCIDLVQARDLIKRFRFGNFVLLQPELLDAYASALVNSVRDDPDGLGSILEAKAKRCEFRIPLDERIQDPEEEALLLLAMIQDMLHHELALLEHTPEGNYLIFPSQSTRVNHELPDREGQALFFEFEGPIEKIYATLAVRLSRSGLFVKKGLWKDAITYTARPGGECGLFQEVIDEGRARLILFFKPQTTELTRFYFEDFVAQHLQRSAISGSVQRFRLFTCPEPTCREPILHSTVVKRRERGFNWLLCSNCGTRVDLSDREERLSIKVPSQTLEMDLAADSKRKLDVLRSSRRKEVEMSQGKKVGDYDLFLCYNPGDRSTIKQISDQLLEMNILPWLDEWETRPGQDWQQVLSAQIASINAVAVFIGKDSPVPWHDPQTDQLLHTFAKKHRIVPVILPECERIPQLPHYIKEPLIDMHVQEPDPIKALIEYIMIK